MSTSAASDVLPGACRDDPASGTDAAELGMWIFLVTELLFFGGLFVAYLYGRTQWPDGFARAAGHTDVVLGTANTALLLTGSFAAALAVAAAGHGRPRWGARLLWVTAALGIAFLAVKGVEYRNDWHRGLVPGAAFRFAAEPGAQQFFIVYFLSTGLHAVHLAIGVIVVATFAAGTGRASAWAGPPRLQAAALYWHFVDVVWIFLYPLLYLVGRHG